MDDDAPPPLRKAYYKRALDDDDDDDDLWDLDALSEPTRRPRWSLDRLDWHEHVEHEIYNGSFDTKYHMTITSFNKLVAYLGDLVEVDAKQSARSTAGSTAKDGSKIGVILPQHIVGMGLRFLGGEHFKSLSDIFRIDVSYVRNLIFNKFLPAIDAKFDIVLPSGDALAKAAAEFKDLSSSQGLFDGVIGAIDGWLCTTCQPIDKDIKNKRDYYSGHYQKYGLNVQAMCDARGRFTYFGVAAPGRTNDARAFLKCKKLRQWLGTLEGTEFFIVGDNAYVLCDELLIPFSGSALPEQRRTYNFFLSQLRIRIEMAFGRLTTKWRIFRQDLTYSMEHNSLICRCAAKLHNYVINEALILDDEVEVEAMEKAPRDLGYFPRHPEEPDETIVKDDPEDTAPRDVPTGFSARRTELLDNLAIIGLSRPARNVARNG